MLNFPSEPIPKNAKERKKIDKEALIKRDLFQKTILEELKEDYKIPVVQKLPLDVYPIGQTCSGYSLLPYGKIGNIAEAGCGVLAVEYALRLLELDVNFEELVNECVNKGYRGYIYDEYENIIDGNGTKYSLFNNLAIKLTHLKQIFYYSEKGFPITILIQNSVYKNDSKNKHNHYITLIGLDQNGNAVLMDGNKITDNCRLDFALTIKPFKSIAPGFRGAWAWSKEKIVTYLN